ncbi:hypothetical protein [Halanaerobacter jeridensis]|uniref:Gas vesicle protein n=1 Tax=Halanaerobacter jeridensis TaxID=706427 RepID=A0A938XYM0_9FIRM|nr:hypothetical protein [Halanaerobacter jeridensis]MBM7558092.1 gas vesicle protein [Halanaerobacter jeridensis]
MITKQVLDGFTERMKNILVFKPLFDLEQKRKYDYSLLELGIAVLLFIFEKMLNNEDCTYDHLAEFLQELIREQHGVELDFKEAKELASHLVRDCLLNQGVKHEFSYHNYETDEEEYYKFDLIRLQEYEIGSKFVKLELSTTGLELLFKTKEIYNELQVSITQLYLKQQIQKGVFDGALDSVEELKLAVKNEKKRLQELREKIIRDVLQVAKEGSYQQELDRINDQLDRESETFEELMELVKETIDKYQENYDNENLNKVMKLRSELLTTTELHDSLLNTKLEISELMNKSMENMILNTFSTTVNFETEILETVINNDNHLEQLQQVIAPLLSSNVNSTFNLNRIFEPQRLYNQTEVKEDELIDLDAAEKERQEAEERREEERKRRQYKLWLELLLEPLLEEDETKLSKVIRKLKQQDREQYQDLIINREFYPFILKLHQLGKIDIITEEELGSVVIEDLFWVITELVAAREEFKEIGQVELVALDDVIKLQPGFVMSDFIVRRVT